MNYWLTTHWPPRKSEISSPGRYWVYLQEGCEQAGKDMQKGDLIFVYETKTGTNIIGKDRRIVGEQGIVALVEAISKLEGSGEKPRDYENGITRHWAWQTRTRLVKKCYISRQEICRALGYDLGFNLRFRSGLKKLSEKQFKDLEAMCK